jgi:hypothetical protein
MASRAGGAASGLATATLLANPAVRQSALIKLTLIFITTFRIWLCSDSAAFIVGHATVIDGDQSV